MRGFDPTNPPRMIGNFMSATGDVNDEVLIAFNPEWGNVSLHIDNLGFTIIPESVEFVAAGISLLCDSLPGSPRLWGAVASSSGGQIHTEGLIILPVGEELRYSINPPAGSIAVPYRAAITVAYHLGPPRAANAQLNLL